MISFWMRSYLATWCVGRGIYSGVTRTQDDARKHFIALAATMTVYVVFMIIGLSLGDGNVFECTEEMIARVDPETGVSDCSSYKAGIVIGFALFFVAIVRHSCDRN